MSRPQIKQQKASHSFTQKLKNEHSKYKTPTDDDDPTLPALMVFQGMRGSGKTHSAVTLAKYFEKKGYVQRTFLLCPNVSKDRDEDIYLTNLKTLDNDNVCDNETKIGAALGQVEERICEDWEEYKQYLLHLNAYKKYQAR